ncbi:MAG: prepilin peptidase [Deferribacteraceae bacterium]|nr:prepilin peptidase [Deferribacteraceae bacterium]
MLYIVIVLGLVFGSFMNVLIYRIPRGISIILPSSFCPKCRKPIRWRSNIPVVSFIVQRGRCISCGERISWVYPAAELLTALLFLLIYLFYGFSLVTIKYCFMTFMMLVAGFTDLTTKLDAANFECGVIPEAFTTGLVFCGFVWAFFTPPGFYEALAGSAGGMFMLLIPAYFYKVFTKRDGMGDADALFMAGAGAFLGLLPVLFVVILSAVLGVLTGIVVIAVTKNRGYMLPFGPMVACASVLFLFAGDPVMRLLGYK